MLRTLRYGQTVFAQWLLALALLAAGTQAALPQGFMLDRNAATGAVSVVICTGHSTETRYVDFASGKILDKSPAEQGQSEVQPCAFSANASSLLKLEVSPLLHKAHLTSVPVFLQKSNTRPLFQAPGRQNSRAPPVKI